MSRPMRGLAARPGPHLAAMIAAAALALALGATGAAGAPPGADPADILVEATSALGAGEHERAAALAWRVAHDGAPIDRKDRAEAWRILGLAQHALGHEAAAEAAFHAYLRLDPDARLDPALVPPEVLHFFEGVKSNHRAELDALRPRPKRRRTFLLNFVPLGGQWQNGDRGKMWIIGSAGAVLVATNIASYVFLRDWCGGPSSSSTCGDAPSTDAARRMQIVNIASGVGALALYTYSVIDGIRGYRRWKEDESNQSRSPSLTVGLGSDHGSLVLTVGGGF
jgi:hypothetical protein